MGPIVNKLQASAPPSFLQGGGEMGALMRAKDWSATPFGAVQTWPQSLRTAVNICLNSRFPIIMWWGPELRLLYNDAYLPVFGQTKHPRALGAPGAEVWPEIWHIIGPMLEGVLSHGEATWSDDGLLMLDRNNFLEEAYFTYSYSPVTDENGDVIGVFTAVNETTGRVVGERQIELLRGLAAQTAQVRSFEEASRLSAEVLSSDPHDVPFALIYALDAERKTLQLTATAGFDGPRTWAPALVDLGDELAWPFSTALNSSVASLEAHIPASDVAPPSGAWEVAPTKAVLLPLSMPGAQSKAGVLIMGVNPHRLLDASYRRFFELVSTQVAASIGNAQAYDKERQRAESLAELARAKTVFFSNVSHEFRTPLTLMLGPLEDLVLGDEVLDPSVRERIEMVQRNGNRLLRLVNSLLDIARIEAGRVHTKFEPVDLAETTRELASVFQSAVDKAGLRLTIDCPDLSEPAYIDRGMWEKIVLNLLSNAFKFTLEGSIAVALEQRGRDAVFSVTDTGIGIPEAEFDRIFERFHRVDGAVGRNHEGTGIGLSLVKELAALHGGSVHVASQPGSGSRFELRLPLGHGHLPAEQVWTEGQDTSSPSAKALVEEAMQYLVAPLGEQFANDGSAALKFRPPEQDEGRPTIVLADDNADMRRYVNRLLSGKYHVLEAGDGAEALRIVQAQRPDLVLTDVMMPLLDGFQLVEALRAAPETASVPVIMLSARAGEGSQIEGLSAGADDYLVKPFSGGELMARVEARLELATLRRKTDAHIAQTLDSITDGLVTFDADWRYTYANGEALRMIGYEWEKLRGQRLWDLFPESLGTPVETTLRRVAETGEAGEFEGYFPSIGRWYQNKAYPGIGGGVTVFFDDVTERHLTQNALAESERHKDEFLATLAHELRNPLAPLRTGLEILVRARNKPETFNKTSELMQRQLGHMVRLIDELLDLSRVSRGLIELKNERLDLAVIVQQAVEMARPLIEEREHTLRVTMPGGHVQVLGDGVRLCQILVNLLNNAAKYTDPRGVITLIVEAHETEICVAVIDNGIGISPEALPKVFDMFSQVSRSFDTTRGGLGIGLALARQLAQLHDGRIEARSEGRGHGSKFILWLPKAETEEEPVATNYGELDDEVTDHPLKILVCDDNRDAAATLASLVEMWGHQSQLTYEGQSALDQLAANRFDLAFLDIGMPGMDGYETCRRIRALPNCGDLTIVALTGWGSNDVQARCDSAGFNDHVLKPADFERLEQIIASVARRVPKG